MTVMDIARAALPGWSDSDLDAVLWNCTGFPGFFRTRNPAKEIYYDLAHYRRMLRAGRRQCDHCAREAVRGRHVCARCMQALDEIAVS